MIPQPTTSSRLGIDGSSNAPVEEKIRGSSGIAGIEAASEPAAMMQLSNVIVRSPTLTVFGPVKAATPVTTSTLRCFARPASPPVSFLTTEAFQARSCVQVHLGLAELDAVLGHLLGLGDDSRGMQ